MSRVSYVMMNPRRPQRADQSGARRDRDADRRGVRAGRRRGRRNPGGGVRRQSDDAPPVPRHRPDGARRAPFALAVSGALQLPRARNRPRGHPAARVYMLPCIAGHVGADAGGGCSPRARSSSDEITLVVDVGTNAEIVLGNRDAAVAAFADRPRVRGRGDLRRPARRAGRDRARAHRPADAGAAHQGDRRRCVVRRAGFDEAVAGVGVTGICGSGIIEAIAEMFLAGIVGADGADRRRSRRAVARIVSDGPRLSPMLLRGRRRRDRGHADRRPRDPAGEGRALCRGAAADGQARRRSGRADQAGRRVRQLHRPEIRDGDRADPGLPARQGRRCRQRRGHRRAHGASEPRAPPRGRGRWCGAIEKIETALETRFQEHFVNAMAFPNGRDAFPHLAAAVALPARREAAEGRRRGGRRRGG